MIVELVEHYAVRSLFVVLRQENFRSVRPLKRLGFSHAPHDAHAAHHVGPGEALMFREVERP